jgi:hypothetical protein
MNETINATNSTLSWIIKTTPLPLIPFWQLCLIGLLVSLISMLIGTGLAIYKFGWDNYSIKSSISTIILASILNGFLFAGIVLAIGAMIK